MKVGIESINLCSGIAYVDVAELAAHRNLDMARFENLLMQEKSVAMPFEDPISLAVNAAKPILDKLSEEDKNNIELLITCSESGIDFGKSISTYVHHYLGLKRNCRLFEIKQACFSGTAGFQMAINFILAQVSPRAKALVIATDISRYIAVDATEELNIDWSFAEPSSGAGAVALLVSNNPTVFQVDVGANGYYGYEVMDTCRPVPDREAGNSDISLMSYLDCCEQAFKAYQQRVNNVKYDASFQYLAFHTPFGGMVKGAHRSMMRKFCQYSPQEIDIDFIKRVMPALNYCQRVGNIMGGTIFLSLLGIIANGDFDTAKRIGLFSYGSGCCSEFYSGVVFAEGKKQVTDMLIEKQLQQRYRLNMNEYELVLQASKQVKFGTRNVILNHDEIPGILSNIQSGNTLFLNEINEFHREYSWR